MGIPPVSLGTLKINRQIAQYVSNISCGIPGEPAMKKGIVDPQVLKEIVRRIVTCAHPERIILFVFRCTR